MCMKKFLVVAVPHVGDLIFTQSLLKVLKQQHLDAEITVMAPPPLRTLLAKMPEVDHWIASSLTPGRLELLKRFKLALEVRKHHFDEAFIISNSWKAALVPFLAGVPRRSGYIGEWRWGLLNHVHKLNTVTTPLMYERFGALAFNVKAWFKRPLPVPKLACNTVELEKVITKLRLARQDDQPILAIAIGSAGGETKCWPVGHQIALAKHYLKLGWQVWLLGSQQEVTKANSIQRATDGRCTAIIGAADLGEVAELLTMPKVLVGGDTGLLHIAAAVGTPVVGLYGASTPLIAPPLTSLSKILWLRDSCSPCFKRFCAFHDVHCMQGISVEMVAAAIDELVKECKTTK